MEGEGRDCLEFYRNNSEDMFLTSMMDGTIGTVPPNMEMMGLRKPSQPLRVDSEELFHSWLMNAEIPGYKTAGIASRTRQPSRRLSTELASLQHSLVSQRKGINNNTLQTSSAYHNFSNGKLRNESEKGTEASNLYLAKTWFNSTHPMTRSRSYELRKRYVEMQTIQSSSAMQVNDNTVEFDANKEKQGFAFSNDKADNGLPVFVSPSTSYTSPTSTPMNTFDAVSSVVSMLKGTIERKKLNMQSGQELTSGFSLGFGFSGPQEIPDRVTSADVTRQLVVPQTLQVTSNAYTNIIDIIPRTDSCLEMEGIVAQTGQFQMILQAQEPSQSESSAATPTQGTGFETRDGPSNSGPAFICDGPSNSGQGLQHSERSRRYSGSENYEQESKEFREKIVGRNSKTEKKKPHLARMESVSSGLSDYKGDATKKRRVERSRKMAEAKERCLNPTVPLDVRSLLKRCENLEKEVRSLKLNLSFMNRKDSEQTTRIEELQQQNDELMDEKVRLLEEIERIVPEGGGVL